MTDLPFRAHAAPMRLRVGEMTLLVDQYTILIGRRQIGLTLVEYRMLLMLFRNVGVTFSMDQLARLDGDRSDPPTNRALRARVATLRRKLGPAGAQIENVRGVGYRLLEVPPSASI